MTAANEYAQALFSLSLETSVTDEVYRDLKDCAEAVAKNPDYIRIIDSPAIGKSEKPELIDKAFGSVCEPLLNLLKILAEHRYFHMLKSIFSAFEELYLEHCGICRAEAISAKPLSKAQLDMLKEKLEGITKKRIILINTVDKGLLGGVKLRYGGVQLDGSLKARLEEIEGRLKNTVL